jgi:hypothetical protein
MNADFTSTLARFSSFVPRAFERRLALLAITEGDRLFKSFGTLLRTQYVPCRL